MTIIACPSCGVRNRIGPVARGTPRCPRCKTALPWVVAAGAGTFGEETTASVPVVVDFWADWCGPCRMIAPVLQDLATRHAGRLKVVKVDVDANQGLAAQFGVSGIPAVKAFRNGAVVKQFVGAQSRASVATFLDELRIEVRGDIDLGASLGLAPGARPGYGAVRVAVRLQGPAPAEHYDALLGAVDEHAPVLDVFRNEVHVQTSVALRPPPPERS
jgi:thioredoxin 2